MMMMMMMMMVMISIISKAMHSHLYNNSCVSNMGGIGWEGAGPCTRNMGGHETRPETFHIMVEAFNAKVLVETCVTCCCFWS